MFWRERSRRRSVGSPRCTPTERRVRPVGGLRWRCRAQAPRSSIAAWSYGSIMMHSPGHSSAASTAVSISESGIRATPLPMSGAVTGAVHAVEDDRRTEVRCLFLDDPEPVVAADEHVGADLRTDAITRAQILVDPHHQCCCCHVVSPFGGFERVVPFYLVARVNSPSRRPKARAFTAPLRRPRRCGGGRDGSEALLSRPLGRSRSGSG